MLSKVVPRQDAGGVQRLVFESFGSPAPAGAVLPSAAPEPPRENEAAALRAQVTELKRALEQQVAAARDAAAREGESRGRLQGEAVVKPVIERLSRSLQDVIEMKPKLRKQAEEEAVHLALAIARRILRRELSVDASALQALAQVAFERLGRQEIHRVIVHPDQAVAIREALSQVTTRRIEVVADGSRESGALIFETARGSLDASLDSQLKEIELGLADRLKWR